MLIIMFGEVWARVFVSRCLEEGSELERKWVFCLWNETGGADERGASHRTSLDQLGSDDGGLLLLLWAGRGAARLRGGW